MKFGKVNLFVFISFFTLQAHIALWAQTPNIKVTVDNYTKSISSLNRRGIDFISVKEFSEVLGASVYFNPENSKLEIKFANGILKLTAQNEFAVYTSRTDNFPTVSQIPLAPVLVHDDLFVAFELYNDIFSQASGRKIEYNKSSKEILIDSKTLLKNKDIIAENKTTENKLSESKTPESKKTDSPKNQASEVKTDAVDKELSKTAKIASADKKELKKEEIEDKPEVNDKREAESNSKKPENKDSHLSTGKKTLSSKYDIAGLSIDPKSNGTLIRLLCKKRIIRYSASINNGILFLNLLGVKADEKALNATESKGLIKKVLSKNIGPNSQIELFLKDGYSTYETLQDSPGNDLLITIHNKMLSKSDLSGKLEKWALRTVVIDAGHGGKDPGAIGVNGTKEKDVNLAIALKLGEIIQDNMPDVKVVYTRSSDKFVELYKRGKIANEKNGNLFISIHCNSTPTKPTSANGFEIYLLRPGRTKEAVSIAERENSVIQYEDNPSHYQKLTDENFILVSMAHSAFMRYSERFSDLLNKQFTSNISLPSNGIKQAGFYVLVGASMPSVLVETGFISNKNDEAYLASKTGQKNIASSIFKSIEIFKEEYEKNLQLELEAGFSG